MGEIRKENFHQSLIEYLDGLGLTEEQVIELIKNNIPDTLISDVESNKNQVAEIKSKNSEQDTAISNAQNKADANATKISNIETKNSEQDTAISNVQTTANTANNTANTNKTNITNLTTTVNNNTNKIGTATLNTLATTLIDAINELNRRINILSSGIKQIACGNDHSMLLLGDGSLWSCGYNGDGQLGLGDTTTRTTFTQVTTNINNDVKEVVCGGSHTFILKNDGSVWCCGLNNWGQLGLGTSDYNAHSTFTQVTNDVKQIACGNQHTFILKNDGSVWSCGNNYTGALGLNDTTDRTTFTQVTTNINNDVKQIACGSSHTFIIKNDGSVWSCGRNNNGRLGLGDTTQRNTFTKVTTNINNDVKQIACGSSHTFILKNDGSIWACGYNSSGQLGLGDTTDRNTFTKVITNINNDVKQIDCSGECTFILKNDGSVWSTGYNYNGNLGLNDKTNRTTFTQVTTNINNDVKQIDCGGNHTFILKNDGIVYSCGLNNWGQLGLNDTTNRNIFNNVKY